MRSMVEGAFGVDHGLKPPPSALRAATSPFTGRILI
jgi:hypothetical protein